MASVDTQQPRFGDRPAAIAVGAMIVVLLALDLLIAWAVDRNVSRPFVVTMFCGLIVGQFIGQLNLISVWAAVSPGSLLVRLPWALLLTTLMWGAFAIGNLWHGQSSLFVGSLLAIGCVVAQIPLWCASRFFHWRLLSGQEQDSIVEGQFNLGQMLLGMGLLAAALAVGRNLAPQVGADDVAEIRNMLLEWQPFCFLLAFIICNLGLVVPCIWAAFHVEPTLKRAGMVFVAAVLVTALQFGGLCLAIGGPGRDHFEWWAYFLMIAVGEIAVVYGCLWTLKKVAGFRFVQINSRQWSESH